MREMRPGRKLSPNRALLANGAAYRHLRQSAFQVVRDIGSAPDSLWHLNRIQCRNRELIAGIVETVKPATPRRNFRGCCRTRSSPTVRTRLNHPDPVSGPASTVRTRLLPDPKTC